MHIALHDQIGDAVRDDARLAAARPGEDQERAIGVLNSFTLGRVQVGEDIHGCAAMIAPVF